MMKYLAQVQIDVYVSQVGVGLTPLLFDGSYSSTCSKLDQSKVPRLTVIL